MIKRLLITCVFLLSLHVSAMENNVTPSCWQQVKSGLSSVKNTIVCCIDFSRKPAVRAVASKTCAVAVSDKGRAIISGVFDAGIKKAMSVHDKDGLIDDVFVNGCDVSLFEDKSSDFVVNSIDGFSFHIPWWVCEDYCATLLDYYTHGYEQFDFVIGEDYFASGSALYVLCRMIQGYKIRRKLPSFNGRRDELFSTISHVNHQKLSCDVMENVYRCACALGIKENEDASEFMQLLLDKVIDVFFSTKRPLTVNVIQEFEERVAIITHKPDDEGRDDDIYYDDRMYLMDHFINKIGHEVYERLITQSDKL